MENDNPVPLWAVIFVIVVFVGIAGLYVWGEYEKEKDIEEEIWETVLQQKYEKCVDEWLLSTKDCYDLFLADDD